MRVAILLLAAACVPPAFGDPKPQVKPAPAGAARGGSDACVAGTKPVQSTKTECAWLVVPRGTKRRATWNFYRTDGKFYTGDRPTEEYVAYRVTPATKQNIAKGVLVASVVGSNGGVPDADGEFWDFGIVESFDWAKNEVRFEGVREPLYLTATRVAVLRFTNGGNVEPVTPDVAKPASTTEAWSQVGKDKKPIAVNDTSPLNDRCPTEHCLRPWVWFVTVEGSAWPARWNGKAFVDAEDPTRVLEKPGVAFRTRAAHHSELKPGMKVILYDSTTKIADEHDAHRKWSFETVESVDHYLQEMTLKDGGSKRPTWNARIMVLYWIAGEPADAVE